MRICIVTVYNSENCGSFLQAYALYRTLKQQENQVCFLFRSPIGTSHDFRLFFTDCLKLLVKRKFDILKNRVKAYCGFTKAIATFDVIKNKSNEMKLVDTVIIGSDTLWNFGDEYFYNNRKTYSGFDFRDLYAITYASSVANTEAEILINDKVICDGIRSLKSISARDKYTASIVSQIKGEEPPIVLDPTLLLTADEYRTIEGECDYDNFLLIYSFREIPKDKIQQIKSTCVKEGIKIIAFGNYREWVDVNIPPNPFNFLAFFRKAKYVITDTYHGTIFSIIYKKQFVCLGQHKNKVRDILETCGLSLRFVGEDEQIYAKLQENIDYGSVYAYLENLKNGSIQYLNTSISGGMNNVF